MEDDKNIATSFNAKLTLLFLYCAIFLVVELFINILYMNSYIILEGVVITLFIFIKTLELITGKVGINKCHELLNSMTGKTRAVFEGFYFKLPWESVQKEVNLEVSVEINFVETFPTSEDNGMVIGAATIATKPYIQGNEKQKSLAIYNLIKYSDKDIEGIIKNTAKQIMREFFVSKNSIDAKKSKGSDILKVSDFKEILEIIPLKIIKCVVPDADDIPEIQRIKEKSFIAKNLANMKNILVSQGWSEEAAKELVPSLDKDVKVNKEIKEIRITGLEMLGNTLKNFIGGK